MGKFELPEEERNFIDEMNFSELTEYERPFAILMSGIPGSGKTHMARTISRELGIFLLSNDLIRNYYYEVLSQYSEKIRRTVQAQTMSQNNKRQLMLLRHRVSFIMDKDFNDFKDLAFMSVKCLIRNMSTFKILINSPDNEENLERISNRHYDLSEVVPGVKGDNVYYGYPYGETAYYNALRRKPRNLGGVKFDYIIDNTGSEEHFDSQIKEVVDDIQTRTRRK